MIMLVRTDTVLKSHQAEKSHIIPLAQRRYGKVTSGSGKSHQGRRNTMAQPVSSVIAVQSQLFLEVLLQFLVRRGDEG